jgi:hypothetical protein
VTVGKSDMVITAGRACIWSGPLSTLGAAGGPGGESWSSFMNAGLRRMRAGASDMELRSRRVASSREDGSADI